MPKVSILGPNIKKLRGKRWDPYSSKYVENNIGDEASQKTLKCRRKIGKSAIYNVLKSKSFYGLNNDISFDSVSKNPSMYSKFSKENTNISLNCDTRVGTPALSEFLKENSSNISVLTCSYKRSNKSFGLSQGYETSKTNVMKMLNAETEYGDSYATKPKVKSNKDIKLKWINRLASKMIQ